MTATRTGIGREVGVEAGARLEGVGLALTILCVLVNLGNARPGAEDATFPDFWLVFRVVGVADVDSMGILKQWR